MLTDELKYQIQKEFRFEQTAGQRFVTDTFARFITSRDDRSAMILRGSAGTGKTTLAGAIVRTMKNLHQKVVLLAPTGRAAKVFSVYSGHPASTIHRRIYRQRKLDGDGGVFTLNYNAMQDTLFIVDEASMVTASMGDSSMFGGAGCLLDDLIRFVYEGRNCRLLLIGDKAQLPPVGESESPALVSSVIESYGLTVYECDLDEVLRQSNDSGILYNATAIRRMIDRDELTLLPKIRFRGFADIHIVPGNELIESLASSYSKVGLDETMVVTRSNKRANIYNIGIRNSVLDHEDELVTGDMLMIVKNNYFYSGLKEERGERREEREYCIKEERGEWREERGECLKEERGEWREEREYCIKEESGEWREEREYLCKYGDTNSPNATNTKKDISLSSLHSPLSSLIHSPLSSLNTLSFIANGDRATVLRVRNIRELYGFRFADMLLRFPDYDDAELQATVILDSLLAEAPALTREQNEKLFYAVMEDYAHIPQKAERIRKIKQDVYYNALQIKYAYAVTCHKAQGGQWAHVYIDQGYMTDEMLTPDYIHWLYTAFTRASEQLFLVNWSKQQTEER